MCRAGSRAGIPASTSDPLAASLASGDQPRQSSRHVSQTPARLLIASLLYFVRKLNTCVDTLLVSPIWRQTVTDSPPCRHCGPGRVCLVRQVSHSKGPTQACCALRTHPHATQPPLAHHNRNCTANPKLKLGLVLLSSRTPTNQV